MLDTTLGFLFFDTTHVEQAAQQVVSVSKQQQKVVNVRR